MKHLTLLLFLLLTTQRYSQEPTFVIKDKKTSIALTLENNATEIALHQETQFTIRVENMDMKNTAVIGRGIRIVPDAKSREENYIQCTTTIDEAAVVDGKYKILFSHRTKKKATTYTFLIPVKTN